MGRIRDRFKFLWEKAPGHPQIESENEAEATACHTDEIPREKTIAEDEDIKVGLVATNIGHMPIADYLEIKAIQYGFDSYEELYREGYRIQGFENYLPDSALETKVFTNTPDMNFEIEI